MHADAVRRLALALPEAIEQDHHGFPSFRVRKKIFATLPDPEHVHVMLDPAAIREAVALDPGSCEEKRWGTGFLPCGSGWPWWMTTSSRN